jgi:dihydroorotate dehydrogenase electron transfer subunit
MPKVLKEKIKSMEQIGPSIFRMKVESAYIAENAKPGQFVNVKCSEGINALLRRPISICNVYKDGNILEIIFQIRGIGTEVLSKKEPGDVVDLIGPLGQPFGISPDNKRIAVVGGGIGIFPLLYLLDSCKDVEKSAFLGFRNKDYVVLDKEFSKAANKLFIATDDGSRGYKGMVTDLLEQDLLENRFDILYACGPTLMIRKVMDIAKKHNIPCQVSLEQRMGCGIGACLVCACKTKLGEEWEYSHVCKDGPVFWSDEVIFDA